MVKDAVLGGDKGGLTVETELIAGNKTEQLETEIQFGHKQSAQIINNKEEIPITFLLIAILGWLLPSPNEMWKGLKSFVPWGGKQ